MINPRQVNAIAEALCTVARRDHGTFAGWERPCAECLGLAYRLAGVLIAPHVITDEEVQGLVDCEDNTDHYSLERTIKFLRCLGDTEC